MKTSPMFAVKHLDGTLYYLDLSWGQGWSEGAGYLAVLPWGEQRRRTGYCRDNKCLVDPDDCEVYELGWTLEDDAEPNRLVLAIEKPKEGDDA